MISVGLCLISISQKQTGEKFMEEHSSEWEVKHWAQKEKLRTGQAYWFSSIWNSSGFLFLILFPDIQKQNT